MLTKDIIQKINDEKKQIEELEKKLKRLKKRRQQSLDELLLKELKNVPFNVRSIPSNYVTLETHYKFPDYIPRQTYYTDPKCNGERTCIHVSDYYGSTITLSTKSFLQFIKTYKLKVTAQSQLKELKKRINELNKRAAEYTNIFHIMRGIS